MIRFVYNLLSSKKGIHLEADFFLSKQLLKKEVFHLDFPGLVFWPKREKKLWLFRQYDALQIVFGIWFQATRSDYI